MTSQTAPLQAGQVRVLHPRDHAPDASPLTVLLLDSPSDTDLPDDITARPGPCRIVHVVAVRYETDLATIADVLIDVDGTGLQGRPFVMMDTVSTVRLDPGCDDGPFGPALGTPLPHALCDLVHAFLDQDLEALTEAALDPALAGEGWRHGTRPFVPGDAAWDLRLETVKALNLLLGW